LLGFKKHPSRPKNRFKRLIKTRNNAQ